MLKRKTKQTIDKKIEMAKRLKELIVANCDTNYSLWNFTQWQLINFDILCNNGNILRYNYNRFTFQLFKLKKKSNYLHIDWSDKSGKEYSLTNIIIEW